MKGISIPLCMHSDAFRCECVQPWPYSPWVCERGRSLGDDWSRLGGRQSLLGSQAAAGTHHGAMRLGMLQGMGLGMVQRWLGMWVLELELGLELVHTGRPIVRKRLWGEVGATISWDHFEPAEQCLLSVSMCVVIWGDFDVCVHACMHLLRCVCLIVLVYLMSSCLIYRGECDRLVCLSLQQVRYLQSSNWVWLLLSPSHLSVTQNANVTDLTREKNTLWLDSCFLFFLG